MNSDEKIEVNFLMPNKKTITLKVPTGISLLEASHMAEGLELLKGSCGGNMACVTCHIIVLDDWHQQITPASEEEEDTLDLANELSEHSRLGCQIMLTKEMDGLRVRVPEADVE